MNIKYEKYTPAMTVGLYEKQEVAAFLFRHLGKYGDPKEDIMKCIEYALNTGKHPGGVILIAKSEQEIVGATIINATGMSGYIPENILVYIATHEEFRGQGIGKKLMENAFEHTEGDIALHVESDNPAKKLYEHLGFENKYLEMRWKRS
ncbi:GNAT family N-acetyltransferase [Ekhidna sp. To15]|uniref:GNAT family N-acetyltransferase n=1 Tax=Ekhidna sp. To15 TaxID=3395267 RepID=UPI003F525F9A